MTEQAIESVAVPVAQAVVKAVEPEAAAFLEAFAQHAETEGAKLKAQVEQLLTQHHAGLLGWIQDHLVTLPGDGQSQATADPTPAVPAPQS